MGFFYTCGVFAHATAHLALAGLLVGQVGTQDEPARAAPATVIVHLDAARCGDRAALLSRARRATRARRAEPILAMDLNATVSDAAGAVTARIERLGGTIRAVLVAPPAIVATLPPHAYDTLAAHRDVARVEPAHVVDGNTGDATGSNNHHAQSVHNAFGLRGEGQVLALVDSGVELSFMGGSGPHPAFLDAAGASRIVRTWSTLGTTLPALTDQNGHGTGTGSVAVGRRWGAGLTADGFAPAAQLASYRITSGAGTLTTTADLAQAYNQILLDIIGGLAIGVVNCSFSGSPDPTAADQQALDALALYGDAVVVTSAGKLSQPHNFDFRASAESQAVSNGLAIGAVAKALHTVAPFSVYGPLHGDGRRIYPDLCAVGQAVHVADRASTATVQVDGTSYAAPMVSGTALLVRQARPDLDANAVRAILLGTASDLQAANPTLTENWFGRGLLRTDRAVATAFGALTGFGNGDPDAARIERGSAAQDDEQVIAIALPANTTVSAALVWMRSDTTVSDNPDLDLDVFAAGGTLLARGNLPRNLYERVVFSTGAAVTCDFVVRGRHVPGDDVGWSLVVNVASNAPRSAAITALAGSCGGSGVDLAAQLVLPVVTGFGDGRTNKPLADKPLTLQAAYDGAQVSTPRQVDFLAFRRAEHEGPTMALGVQLRITLGYTAQPPNGLTSNLNANFVASPPRVIVFDDWFDLPPTLPAPTVDEFDFVIPLQPAWQLDGSHGNPLVQIEVLGNDRGNLPQPIGLDAVLVTTGQSLGAMIQFNGSPLALAVQQRPVIAFAAAQPRGRAPRFGYAGTPRLGSTMRFALADARENSLVASMFGSGTTWLGATLPLDLGPFGGGGCELTAAPDVVTTAFSGATGQYAVDVVFPSDPAMLGQRSTTQFLVFDPAANALGLVTSNAFELLFGN